MQARSIAEVPEHELVDLIHSDSGLFRMVGFPPQTSGPKVSFRVRVRPGDLGLPDTAFGDVDSLVVTNDNCAQARATEFKRVKIKASTFHTGRPNKLTELTKAVAQANKLVAVGFAAVWLSVIAVIDGREQTGGRFVLVPGIFEFMDWIKAVIRMDDLDPSVGLALHEIVQPVDRPANETGMSGGQMLRGASIRTQPTNLTDAIVALMARDRAA